MRSKEQFDLQMQWLDKELKRYNNYKKEAVIERFNQLRSILRKEIKDLDLTITYDTFWNELNFSSITLGLDRDNFISFTRSYLYRENFIFKELIDLVKDYHVYFGGSYNPSYKVL